MGRLDSCVSDSMRGRFRESLNTQEFSHMAKKRKASIRKGAKAKPATVAAKPSETMKVIGEAAFKRLCSQVKNAEGDKNEAVGRMGGLISSAVEKLHLHKGAFADYQKYAKLSDNR